MAIYRGDGGAGDASGGVTINVVTALTQQAEAAAAAAASSETAAGSSASSASTSATNAASSESAASASASAASGSASSATASATAADAAKTAAQAAQVAAEAADLSASGHEVNAQGYAANALAYRNDADAAASAAATSESNASASESAAAASASAAAGSASAASSSASSAASSASSAQAALDAINGSYLGAQASDPTLDLNGDAVTAGDWYFNTSSNVTRIYSGSVWDDVAVSLATAMLKANNLSDVADAATARTNLGLGTGNSVTFTQVNSNGAVIAAGAGSFGDDTDVTGDLTVTGHVGVGTTLGVNSILDASGGSTATVNGYTPTASNMAGRNRIINGDMRIDQRNAGASVATTATGVGTYTLDRWAYIVSQASKFTVQQNAGSVTPPVGFTNYIGFTSTSAYSISSTDYFDIFQAIEGFNTADLGWGTANAASITVSFWVRSSLTGTFGASIKNGLFNRSYTFTYTISAANTWEKKTVTIAGDTSGTWNTTSDKSIVLSFGLGVGSSYSNTSGAWVAGNYSSATGSTSVVGTSGATFYITGVQLEEGSVATPFEHRQYGQELALCQRYYWKETSTLYGGVYGTTTGIAGVSCLPVTMRAIPTLGYSAVRTTTGLSSYISKSSAQYIMTSTTPYVTGLTASAEL